MHIERLLKLASLLDANADNPTGVKFSLHTWGEIDQLDFEKTPEGNIPLDCGTTACAIGLACISGAFADDGLTFRLTSKSHGMGNNFSPLYQEHREFAAVREFFGLKFEDAHYLFLDDSYPADFRKGAVGERAVAKRIRDFVENGNSEFG